MVKVNFPHPDKRLGVAVAYDAEFPTQQAVDAVVRSANRTLVLISGGERAGDDATMKKPGSRRRRAQPGSSSGAC